MTRVHYLIGKSVHYFDNLNFNVSETQNLQWRTLSLDASGSDLTLTCWLVLLVLKNICCLETYWSSFYESRFEPLFERLQQVTINWTCTIPHDLYLLDNLCLSHVACILTKEGFFFSLVLSRKHCHNCTSYLHALQLQLATTSVTLKLGVIVFAYLMNCYCSCWCWTLQLWPWIGVYIRTCILVIVHHIQLVTIH